MDAQCKSLRPWPPTDRAWQQGDEGTWAIYDSQLAHVMSATRPRGVHSPTPRGDAGAHAQCGGPAVVVLLVLPAMLARTGPPELAPLAT